jgi:acyl-CoA synthetase (NDP forming)
VVSPFRDFVMKSTRSVQPIDTGYKMERFFNPDSIAIVGASANPMKGGYRILKNILNGFKGDLYPVNPRYADIDGITCYPRIHDIPGPVDMAIIFVPALAAVQAVKDCAANGILRVMIQSAGFAETGDQGKALQAELLKVKAESGMRIWGPNCMGFVDAVHKKVFSFALSSIWEDGLLPGNVSLIVQSGMLSAGFLIDTVTHGTMGISKACSIGNKTDVDECDLLEYLIDDPDTDVIGTYLESIADGQRFMATCRRSPKPIVVLKGGKSKRGAEAAKSHTASLAGDAAIVSGALAQVGAIEAQDFKQMMDLCRTLAMENSPPAPQNGKIAVLTFSGGAGIVSADFIDAQGLETAILAKETIQKLQTVFPDWMPPSNPVDLWPAIEKNGFGRVYHTAFGAVSKDPGVDAILHHVFIPGGHKPVDLSHMAAMAHQAGKPIFCWMLGHRDTAHSFQAQTQRLGIPVFRELHRAVECMAAYFQYHSFAAQKGMDSDPSLPGIPKDLLVISQEETGVLDEYQAKQILARAGIPVVAETIVASPEEAGEQGTALGFPIVMKGLSPGQVHKTEGNLVRLNIHGTDQARTEFQSLKSILGEDGSILVQKQVQGELELIVGLIRDPQFGPCVMCGVGGVMAEALNDTAFAVAPLSMNEALALIDRLKTRKLLDGFRGNPPLDKNAFAAILVRVGELGRANPRIREVDINPLIISRGRPIAVDATIILDGCQIETKTDNSP